MNFLLMLQKRFFRRFMDGRPGPWGALAAGVFGFRTLLRWSRRTEEIVYRGELEPGRSLVITHTGDTEVSLKKDRRHARKDRRRAERARRKADRVARRRGAGESGGDDS